MNKRNLLSLIPVFLFSFAAFGQEAATAPKKEGPVRRAAGAVLRVDHRRADDPLLREVFEDEEKLALGGRHVGRERLLRTLEDLLDVPAIGGQVDGVEVLRNSQNLLDILSIRLANPKHRSRGDPTTSLFCR